MFPPALPLPTSYLIGLPQSCNLEVSHKYSVYAILLSTVPPLANLILGSENPHHVIFYRGCINKLIHFGGY